jgi:hypothetical protein
MSDPTPNLPQYTGGIPYPPGMTPLKAGAILFKAATAKSKGNVHGHGGKRSGAGRKPASMVQAVSRAMNMGGKK